MSEARRVRSNSPIGSMPPVPAVNDSQLPAVCSNCGAPLPTSDWHPIRATTDAKGEFAVHGFCDEDCLEEWVASQDGST